MFGSVRTRVRWRNGLLAAGITAGLLTIGGVFPVAAQSPIPIVRFVGSVSFDGKAAADGLSVVVQSAAAACGAGTVAAGRYAVDIPVESPCHTPGEQVAFFVGGRKAAESATVPATTGTVVRLDLTVEPGAPAATVGPQMRTPALRPSPAPPLPQPTTAPPPPPPAPPTPLPPNTLPVSAVTPAPTVTTPAAGTATPAPPATTPSPDEPNSGTISRASPQPPAGTPPVSTAQTASPGASANSGPADCPVAATAMPAPSAAETAELNRLRCGRMSYDYPRTITSGASGHASATLFTSTDDRATPPVKFNPEPPLGQPLPFATYMRVDLSSTGGISIGRLYPGPIQTVQGRPSVTWVWDINATQAGPATLTFIVSAIVLGDGVDPTPQQLLVATEQLTVAIDSFGQFRSFAGNNWQWGLSTLILPVGGLVVKRRRDGRKRRSRAHQHGGNGQPSHRSVRGASMAAGWLTWRQRRATPQGPPAPC